LIEYWGRYKDKRYIIIKLSNNKDKQIKKIHIKQINDSHIYILIIFFLSVPISEDSMLKVYQIIIYNTYIIASTLVHVLRRKAEQTIDEMNIVFDLK